MIKTFEQNGATYTFDMKHIFTQHKLWLDSFANIPHHFSAAFCNMGEFMRCKDQLMPAPGTGVKYTGHENVCGEIRVHFTADTKDAAYTWKHEHFDPLFRAQAVDFFKENHYLPYNFAGAFCSLKAGEGVEFHGRIPCWEADLDKVNPLKQPQSWRIVSSDDVKTCIAKGGKEYQIDTYSLFDESVFIAEYIQKTPDIHHFVNCARYVYQDPSLQQIKPVYTAELCIEQDRIAYINQLMSMTGSEIYDQYGLKRDETITNTLRFKNGYEMDVKVVICDEDDTPYIDVVLFDEKGCELACDTAFDTIEGEFSFETKAAEFKGVIKSKEKNLDTKPLASLITGAAQRKDVSKSDKTDSTKDPIR